MLNNIIKKRSVNFSVGFFHYWDGKSMRYTTSLFDCMTSSNTMPLLFIQAEILYFYLWISQYYVVFPCIDILYQTNVELYLVFFVKYMVLLPCIVNVLLVCWQILVLLDEERESHEDILLSLWIILLMFRYVYALSTSYVTMYTIQF